MDFDLAVFSQWLMALKPEYIYLGFNSRPKQVQLPEPSGKTMSELMSVLQDARIPIRAKDLRGLV